MTMTKPLTNLGVWGSRTHPPSGSALGMDISDPKHVERRIDYFVFFRKSNFWCAFAFEIVLFLYNSMLMNYEKGASILCKSHVFGIKLCLYLILSTFSIFMNFKSFIYRKEREGLLQYMLQCIYVLEHKLNHSSRNAVDFDETCTYCSLSSVVVLVHLSQWLKFTFVVLSVVRPPPGIRPSS